jgi:hypothetical protein
MCPGSEELDLACELAMIARNILVSFRTFMNLKHFE